MNDPVPGPEPGAGAASADPVWADVTCEHVKNVPAFDGLPGGWPNDLSGVDPALHI